MAAPRRYEIRLFDRSLVEFSVDDGLLGPDINLNDYDDTASPLMPCGLSLSPEGIRGWLETRSIPTNRRNASRICRELGFELGDLEALYRVSMGLSLNDSYWVVPSGFDGSFDEFNLYDNPFSEAIGALAVSGEVPAGSLAGNTPELTTDGTLRKGWRIVGRKRVLYKGASDGCDPGEPLSEYLASLVARDLQLDAVAYGLDEWQGKVCSTCEDFASKETSYVPFAVATGFADLAGALWWVKSLGPRHLESFCDMLAFDALVCNTDRHFTNFGVLRDNATGLPIGLAPIFDNGRSLFPNVAEDDAAQFALESQLRGPAFGGRSFEELVSRVAGPRQHALLELASERGIVGNVMGPGRRVAALDSFLRSRGRELACIPEVDMAMLSEALDEAMAKRGAAGNGAFRLAPTRAVPQ
jgi:hypothetical protein